MECCLRGVNYEREVNPREHLFDQWFPELPLHEVVASDDADVNRCLGELEASLRRNGEAK